MGSTFLGVICYQGHGSAAALVREGVITDAIAEERFSRKKQDTSFPARAIRHILDSRNLSIHQIDRVGFAWSPVLSLAFQMRHFLRYNPHHFSYYFSERNGHHGFSRFDKFAKMLRISGEFRKTFDHCPPISYIPHHIAHSFAACAGVTDSHALSVVADGSSEGATVSVYEVRNSRHRLLSQTAFPHSFGILYSAVTQYLGFTPDSDEYKVMGMSAYGRSKPDHAILRLADLRASRLELDLKYFNHHRSASRFFSESLRSLLGENHSFDEKADIARAVQDLLEQKMLELLEQAISQLVEIPPVLCTSGGVFLNCLLNQKIRERLGFKKFHFSPIADDNGTALGAAAYLHWKHASRMPQELRRLDLGPEYEAGVIENAVRPLLGIKKTAGPAAISLAASRIAKGDVVGFMQGRAEFGPRALGFRSLLADPRNPEMKAILNEKVKLRESFRPFAPSVLVEHAPEYFEIQEGLNLPFMIETVRVRPGKAHLIPAVTHVDGTARIQTVSRDANPAYYDVISAFEQQTGVPMLLNTSFNLDKEPIVNSPQDAIGCFTNSGIDGLLIGDWFLEK
ncbi:MAG: hypothetical protein A2X94_01790 [Bdellovibrionales bacterium GWB1_55_8]|nr:MAG: hypothetical protein A2X94_01790 [Bdellovibrionales bacterium GWB1_55_8]